MHLFRTRFATDIVAEFLPPKKPSNDVVIFCDGMPTVPGKKKLMQFFSKKGYWTVNPRYRGTWESGGTFLDHDPTDDIRDVIDGLFQPIKSLWDGVAYNVQPQRIIIVGCSFGGPAALLLSKDPRVSSVITVAGVVDWTVESEEEPLDWLYEICTTAFGNGYRIEKSHWDNLKTGTFYNPMTRLEDIAPEKVLMIHAKDDTVVPCSTAERFAEKTGAKLILRGQGDHLSSSIVKKWTIWRQVKKHITR